MGVYVGQWSHGIRTGFGRIVYNDDSYYEGFWVNNERHFHGRSVSKDRDVYVFDNNESTIGWTMVCQ